MGTADVNFVFDEEVVPAHKCMLAFHSPVFRQMLYGEPELPSLLQLAHMYNVEWLEAELTKVLNAVIKDNTIAALWVLPQASFYSYDDMQKNCIKQIHRHGNSLIKSAEFLDFEKEMMDEILTKDFVDRNEATVFENCIEWAKRACEKAAFNAESPVNIRAQLGDSFNLIRFESMTEHQFLQ